jgi:hypothetical protein
VAGRARQRRGAKDALAGAHQPVDRAARRGWLDQAAANYFRRQSPTAPAEALHLAPVPCKVAAPSLQIADTSTSPSLQATTSPAAST